jgi:hypothetical protein
MDKTMIDASKNSMRIIIHANSPHLFTKNEVKLEQVTFGLCISAFRGYIHPLCILPLKHLLLLENRIINFCSTSGQENGFISNDIWHVWSKNVSILHVTNLHAKFGLSTTPVFF